MIYAKLSFIKLTLLCHIWRKLYNIKQRASVQYFTHQYTVYRWVLKWWTMHIVITSKIYKF